MVPSDRTIVIERFRDEIGDWRLCVLSPFGGRVHAAWGLALSARIRDEFGLESDAIWSDDGIIVHLPDADEPPGAELVLVEPDEVEDLVVAELSASALYGARFRENAARALLLPRAYPGKRTPLWQQRLKAQSLLEVAKRYGQFPIVLETYRECLRDVLDLPGLEELLRGLHTRELSLVEVETQRASPFASSLLFDYVATYMYEGDTPNAERRAAALSLDRDLLRELLGQEELRDLIDAGALDGGGGRPPAPQRAHAGGQRRLPARRAARGGRPDRRRGAGALPRRRCRPSGMLDDLESERRAVRMRIGGEERYIAAEDAGLYRDAFGAMPPGGLPAAFLEEVDEPLDRIVRRYARTHGPFTTRELADRYAIDVRARRCAGSSRPATWCAASCAPAASEREWCDPEVLRRLRRASLASLRKEVEPAEQRALARFLPAWQGVDASPPGGAGVDRLREMLVPLQGVALAPEVWEQRRPAAPRRRLLARLDRPAVRLGRAGVGGRRGARASARARWRCCSARTRACSARRRSRPTRPASRCTTRSASGWRQRRGVLDRPAGRPRRRARARRAPGGAVGPGLGGRGHQRRVRAAARAPPLARPASSASTGRRFSRRRRPGRAAGPGPLVAHRARCSPTRPRTARACARSPSCCWSATGSSRARPCSPRASPAASPRSTASCRTSRRSAPRGAATSWRASAARSSRCRPRSSGCAACAPTSPPAPLVLATTDPANPFGATLPWPKREGENRRPSRVPGAYVVTLDAEPVLYVERGGKGPAHARGSPGDWLRRGARGAGRPRPPGPVEAPGHRALRRRAGGWLGVREIPHRGRLPPDSAEADPERLMLLIDTRDPEPDQPVWEPDWAVWWRGTLAAAFGIAAFFTAGALSYLAMMLAIYFLCATIDRGLPYRGGLTEYRQ